MASRKCVTISISPKLHAIPMQALASGSYGNFSELIRAALRPFDEHERRTNIQSCELPLRVSA